MSAQKLKMHSFHSHGTSEPPSPKRTDSIESKDSGSFDGTLAEEDYQVMHAEITKRTYSALPNHRPGETNINGRKISVPSRRPLSVFDPPLQKPPRKFSMPAPLPQHLASPVDRQRSPSTKSYDDTHLSSPVKDNDMDGGTISNSDSSPDEPIYYQLEEEIQEIKGITFYDVKIDVPVNANLKMSEKELKIETNKVNCVLTFCQR